MNELDKFCRVFGLFQAMVAQQRALANAVLILMAAILGFSGAALAQQNDPAETPPTCSTPAHRAFDFWIGAWDVTPAGRDAPTAVNRINVQHGGCVIREDYTTKGGYTGMSMSLYDRSREMWHQTWMGTDGDVLFIEGGLNDEGAMVLSNQNTPYFVEGSTINRITWTPNKDGSVRQHWQSSEDGQLWTTVFDGLYVKRNPQPKNP